jgi:HlyD family secretion protein
VFVYAPEVESVAAAPGAVAIRITGPGTVQARVSAALGARLSATVTALHADQGDTVRRGQVLATLDARDLAARKAAAVGQQDTLRKNIDAVRASVAKAEADLDLARSRQRRDAELVGKGFVSQAAMDASTAALRAAEASAENAKATLAAREMELRTVAHEISLAEAVYSYAHVVSPLDGLVVQRSAEVGNMVVPGSPLFRLVDPSTLWVTMRVDESALGLIAEGQTATLRLRSGETLPGRVARIGRQSDAATRELQVDVAFDTPPKRFTIDQEALASIHAGEEAGVVIPVGALVAAGGNHSVLAVRDGRAQLQRVKTGASDGERIVVREGLQAGERVIAQPQSVRSGARVRPRT